MLSSCINNKPIHWVFLLLMILLFISNNFQFCNLALENTVFFEIEDTVTSLAEVPAGDGFGSVADSGGGGDGGSDGSGSEIEDTVTSLAGVPAGADSGSDGSGIANLSRAVVHMGPHKTGSTTIQDVSSSLRKQLEEDGYEMPWVVDENENLRGKTPLPPGQPRPTKNQVNFATCFREWHSIEKNCDPNLLLAGLKINERHSNLLVSSETFDKIDLEGANKLSTYLSPWDEAIIVVVYRHYHSWLASVYNQLTKRRIFGDPDSFKESIVDFVLRFLRNDLRNHVGLRHASQLVEFLTKTGQFSMDDIVIINMQNKTMGGPDEAMFCHPRLNATHTCNEIRRREKNVRSNHGDNLEYGDLAYGAHQAGLIQIKTNEHMKQVTKRVQNHHEQALKLTINDFQRICLPQDALETLFQMSLKSEKKLYPELFHDESNSTISTAEAELRSDFEMAAKTSLCKLDVNKTLAEEVWQKFFRSLN